jgi:hypothetical protein
MRRGAIVWKVEDVDEEVEEGFCAGVGVADGVCGCEHEAAAKSSAENATVRTTAMKDLGVWIGVWCLGVRKVIGGWDRR